MSESARHFLIQNAVELDDEAMEAYLEGVEPSEAVINKCIRNAVLTAAVLAQARGTPIEFGDVASAVGDEYRKLGRQAPADLGVKR